jgi:putative metallohydrolase (TIGR04338 family)
MPHKIRVTLNRNYEYDPPKTATPHGDTGHLNRYLDGHTKTKYGHERDSRRQNLYDAEQALARRTDLSRFPWDAPDVSLEEVAGFVEDICSKAWWQRRYKTIDWTIHDGRGMRNARGGNRWWGGVMKLPSRARTPLVILHEMSHAVVPSPHAHHGRLFAARMAELIGWHFGEEYEKTLKDCYREHNVKWHPHRSVQV